VNDPFQKPEEGKMTDREIARVLECFDLTEPALQRRILIRFVADRVWLLRALEASVYLQSHYAQLLNASDDGQRMVFADAQAWIDRLAQVGKLPYDHGVICDDTPATPDPRTS
jgi:hypothetical protein